MLTDLSNRDGVFVMALTSDDNRLSDALMDDIESHLDTVLKSPGAPLVTVGAGKFFSNGLDIEWLSKNRSEYPRYIGRVQALLSRLLTFPAPTAAALNGHTYGAGAFLAFAHEFKIMREDRGFLCLPEVDLGMPFTPGIAALIESAVSAQAATALMHTGQRLGGPEAAALRVVDATAPAEGVLDAAIDRLRPLQGKDPATLAAIKQVRHSAVAKLLLADLTVTK